MNERTEKARDEFLSEAQEIVEQFNRDMLAIAARSGGAGHDDVISFDPELVNDAFRQVHSLKGLAGLFGVTRMAQLSHSLENLLDALRLGKRPLTQRVLDVLFEGVEHFQLLIAEVGSDGSDGSHPGHSIDDFIRRVESTAGMAPPRSTHAPPPPPPPPPASTVGMGMGMGMGMGTAVGMAPPSFSGPGHGAHKDEPSFGDYDIDPMLLAVLTEYEEHRLRENVREGRSLYRIIASFPLMTIDLELEQLKGSLKPVGEVITYLPGSGGADPERIELEVLLGSLSPLAAVQQAVTGTSAGVEVRPMPRRGQASTRRTHPSLPPMTRTRPPEPAQRAPSIPPVTVSSPGLGSRPVEPPQPAGASAASAQTPPQGSAAGPGFSPEAPTTLKSVAQTVRVDIRKLDHLMNIVGELSLVRSGLQQVQDALRQSRQHTELARALQDEVRMLSRKIDELQAGILEVRMVPLGQVFDKLSRVVRKLSREASKEIRFVVSGADTELDKLIIEELSDPLMHVIRNSIDHGIEHVGVRRAAGKPEAGTVVVSAEQRGNHVVLEVEDDGAGIDAQALLRRAIARGMLSDEQARELSLREIYNLMFLPGLSTRDQADEVSGRGVGMDVVKTNIARMSGIIDVASEPGQGTRLTITLPITLAIIQALVIRCAGRTYAIPLNSVMESLMLQPEQIRTIERREVLSLRDQTLPLLRLEDVFCLRRPPGQPAPDLIYVVVVALAQHRLGLLVDELLGQQDIVIKSLGRALQGIPGIAGATELSGQQTALVLDVRALAEEALPRAVEAA